MHTELQERSLSGVGWTPVAGIMPECTLRVAQTADGYRIRVEGRGTAQESPALAAFVSQCRLVDEDAQITVDLSACEYLDSTFLGCLVTLSRDCGKSETARFEILADNERRTELLAPTRIDQLLQFADADPEMRSGYVTIDPAQLDNTEFGRHVLESHQALAEVSSAHTQLFQEIAKRLADELEDQES
jgi:anti-anti-sigma regulatory factor